MKLFPDDHETIAGTARRLRQGETTCVEVLQSCLDRIEQREHEVRAWVLVDRDWCPGPGSMSSTPSCKPDATAGRCTGFRSGSRTSSMCKGLPTDMRDCRLGGEYRPDRRVHRGALRAAGAIILGKTVTTPFAWIDPPVTRNPWNLERTPGGSSSGSAAAVACGMCLAALGTQTGGSITRPAAFCGVAGMKPTFGYIDDQGIFPLAPTLDHPGFIARSVADLRLLFEVCRRPDLPAEQDGPWVRGAVDRPRLSRPLRALRQSRLARNGRPH